MSSRLLTLPNELKLAIAESLTPFIIDSSDYHYSDCRTMADDIEAMSTSLRYLRNFSMTCSDLQALCSHLVFQGMDLTNEAYLERFKECLTNGTLPEPIRDGSKTRFLSVGSFASLFHCDEHRNWGLNERDLMICKVFTHFSSVTTLDLVNFPLSHANVFALGSLKALRTLSIRDPDPTYGNIHHIGNFQAQWPMPAVANLSIVVSDFKACSSISNILKFLEKSIIVLSIRSENKSGGMKRDFLGLQALDLDSTRYINLAKLKHLSIGYLQFSSLSFREFITSCRKLESLEVDCRGTHGLLPVFYIFDLLQIITGESDDYIEMMQYDWIQEGYDQDPELQLPGMEDPYVTDARIWRRCISSFSCIFALAGSPSDEVKTVKHFELVLASSDSNLGPVNADMCLGELSQVFRRRAPTFRALKMLSLAMSKEVPFNSRESEDQVKATVSQMCRRNLPSVRNVNVDWGQFHLSAERKDRNEAMKYVNIVKPRNQGKYGGYAPAHKFRVTCT